jgi:excisionase family DNA binding protein
MTHETEETKSKKSLKNVRWVAHYLGVSRNTVHEWVIENHIPYINLGVPGGRRVIRFDQDAIDAWLLARSHAAGEPQTDSEKNQRNEKDE